MASRSRRSRKRSLHPCQGDSNVHVNKMITLPYYHHFTSLWEDEVEKWKIIIISSEICISSSCHGIHNISSSASAAAVATLQQWHAKLWVSVTVVGFFQHTHTLRTVILLLLLLTEMCRLSSRGKVAPTPTLLIIMALLWYYHVTGGIQAERIQLFWINRNNPVDIERHNSRRCVVAVWQEGAALCKLHCQRLISSSILLLQYQSVHQTVIQRRTSQSDYKLPRW